MQLFSRHAKSLSTTLTPAFSTDSHLNKMKAKDIPLDNSLFFYRVMTSVPSHFHRYRWMITDVSEKIRQARKHPTKPLLSPVWCTHNGGYRVQIQIYLNGNGRCLRTHMSVFMAFRAGPDNAFLKWPVCGTMSFFLLDQERKNARPIVCSLRSDPKSSSFTRPPQDSSSVMNIASGCPDFTPISTLCDTKYVKDDTIFLESCFY